MDGIVNKCYWIARNAHDGQFRRDGETPYMAHPIDVELKCAELWGDSEELECIALLHDVIEDTEVTMHDLLEAEIPLEVREAVLLLTKKDGQSYDDYLWEIRDNDLARKVKIADMICNLSDKPTIKQINKYGLGLEFLSKGLLHKETNK